jgi:hypothetical protein
MIMGAPSGVDNSERTADTTTQQLRRAVETAAAAQKPARRPLPEHLPRFPDGNDEHPQAHLKQFRGVNDAYGQAGFTACRRLS